jgi:hypothetical protein
VGLWTIHTYKTGLLSHLPGSGRALVMAPSRMCLLCRGLPQSPRERWAERRGIKRVFACSAHTHQVSTPQCGRAMAPAGPAAYTSQRLLHQLFEGTGRGVLACHRPPYDVVAYDGCADRWGFYARGVCACFVPGRLAENGSRRGAAPCAMHTGEPRPSVSQGPQSTPRRRTARLGIHGRLTQPERLNASADRA